MRPGQQQQPQQVARGGLPQHMQRGAPNQQAAPQKPKDVLSHEQMLAQLRADEEPLNIDGRLLMLAQRGVKRHDRPTSASMRSTMLPLPVLQVGSRPQ